MKSDGKETHSFWTLKECLRCVSVLFLVALASWLLLFYIRSTSTAIGAYGQFMIVGLVFFSTVLTLFAVAVTIPSWTNAFWRWLVFFLGDIKSLHAFPWLTWSQESYLIDFADILPALPLIKYGDIGLHRSKGFLSNLFIRGFMKHAWIHVQDGVDHPEIVEAVSEGVLKRNAIYPILSDYTILLTPVDSADITDEQRKGACLKAKQLAKEGVAYDSHFEFNIEEEIKYFRGVDEAQARKDLEVGKEQIRFYHIAFSCTEVVAYSWWHRRESLGITRQKSWGKSVILADSFLNDQWRIKWASNGVTPELARKMGLHEKGVKLIEAYRSQNAAKAAPEAPEMQKRSRV